jgi:hypothetical protein
MELACKRSEGGADWKLAEQTSQLPNDLQLTARKASLQL